jgi:hypothetical protein
MSLPDKIDVMVVQIMMNWCLSSTDDKQKVKEYVQQLYATRSMHFTYFYRPVFDHDRLLIQTDLDVEIVVSCSDRTWSWQVG